VDLDFLLTEIHVGEPAALVEYKHFRAKPVNVSSAVFTALRKLADRAEIPFLVAWCWPSSLAFRVLPLNELARAHFEDPEDLTERAYVQRLYRMRRLARTRSLSESLLDVLPPENGTILQHRIRHAWLEKDGMVYDPVYDRIVPDSEYTQKLATVAERRYDRRQAAQAMCASGDRPHWDPWHDNAR
jgi:hypothetical protein